MSNKTDELVKTIREGIQKRGFFLLMDDRLDLITEGHQNGRKAEMIHAFAGNNGWHVKQEEEGVIFHKSGENTIATGVAEILEKLDPSGPNAL